MQILLAIGLGAAGTMKLVKSKAQLDASPHMGWVRAFSEGQIKLLAAAEVLGTLGLILPTQLASRRSPSHQRGAV